jgi:hypothetical protein
MKKFNILITTSAITLLATGCVKPAQDTQATQPIYSDTVQEGTQSIYNTTTTQGVVYEEAQPIIYAPSAGQVYEDTTVITTSGVDGQVITYPDPYANAGTGTVINDSYNTGTTGVTNNPYSSQQVITEYPATSSSAQGGGIHLQIAALKDYYTAEDYKNKLSLAPGLSAYVQRGAMNKVIVTGITSITEANRLKESRFPGAFIVQGGNSGSYTPAVQPNYDTNNGSAYNVNNPYGVSSSAGAVNTGSGIGVQVGAFGSMTKAQSVVNSQHGQYPAIVKKIGRYYKVILTGFSSRSAAKAHASTMGGFVVNY